MDSQQANDELVFIDDDQADAATLQGGKPLPPWRVLVVDDDADVHDATRLVLSSVQVLGRDMTLLHARSAAEARELLQRESDVAVILLDVVMEEEDAGLKLVDYIRCQLGMDEVRIILRTGQPGHAPELEAIRDYDINDYKTKTELTRHKLYTTLTTALRSYAQICTINASRRGLELIVDACQRLTAENGLQSFAAGVITQMAALLGLPPEGLICARCVSEESEESEGEYQIVAAAGRYTDLVCRPLDRIANPIVREMLTEALRTRTNVFRPDGSALFFSGASGKDMAAFVDSGMVVPESEQRLLEVFCRNVGPCLDNIDLIERLNHRIQFEVWLHIANRSGLCDAIGIMRQQGLEQAQALTLLRLSGHEGLAEDLKAGLVEVARRLREKTRGQGIAAYLAPDRFAVLTSRDALAEDELRALLSLPLALSGGPLSLTVGSLRLPLESLRGEPEAALAAAELALSVLPDA